MKGKLALLLKIILFIALVVIFITFAVQGIKRYNQNVRARQVLHEQHVQNVRMCRAELGLDYGDFGQHKLMMACVHELTKDLPASGSIRSRTFDNAWQSCMPAMDSCSKALVDDTP